MKNRLLSSKPIFVLAALLLALVMASSTAFASSSTGTIYSIAQATATPQYQCTDIGCTTLIEYSYSGQGACQTGCVAFPSGPVDATLMFTVIRTFPPNPCLMQKGTGLLDVTWPSDPSLPSAQGTFTFKAQDSKSVDFEGSITASTLSVLLQGEPFNGFVTFPPSPCVGGTATAAFTFG
jgi:hypothetical protein